MALSSTAKILIGCGSGAILFIFIVVGLAGWGMYTFVNNLDTMTDGHVPESLRDARVLKGEGILTRSEFFKMVPLSFMDIMKKSATIQDENERVRFWQSETGKKMLGMEDMRICGDEILAAGVFGAIAFDRDGMPKKEILYEAKGVKVKVGWIEQEDKNSRIQNPRIVALDDKGTCGFSSHGSINGAAFFDADGKLIWSYGGLDEIDVGKMISETEKTFESAPLVYETAVGDLDGDGISEFILEDAKQVIHAYDQLGKEIWLQPLERASSNLLILDFDGDGKNDLLESGMNTNIRDETGKIIKTLETGSRYKSTIFLEDREKKMNLNFCDFREMKLICRDQSGKDVFEGDAPMSEATKDASEQTKHEAARKADAQDYYVDDTHSVYESSAAWIKLKKDKPNYLAVVASFGFIPRANFYLYEQSGNLVYHELLPEGAKSLVKMPTSNGTDEILVNGKHTIWKYTMN